MLRSAAILALVGAATAESESPFATAAKSALAGIPGRSPAGRSLLAVEATACSFFANNLECSAAETAAACDALADCAYDSTSDWCASTATFTDSEMLQIASEQVYLDYATDLTECNAASDESACDDILKCSYEYGTCILDGLYTTIHWSNECAEVAAIVASSLPGNVTMADLDEAADELGIEVSPTLENALAAEGMDGAEASNAVTFSAALITTVAAAALTMA
jgi:hypothetical protein